MAFIFPKENSLDYQATTQLNIRTGAGVNYATVGSISQGDKVLIDTIVSGWGRVVEDGKVKGFASIKYLTTDFKDYSNSSKADKKDKSPWGSIVTILVLLGIGYYQVFGKKKSSNSSSRSSSPKPPLQKNVFISQVKEDGHWLRVYNSEGKQLSVRGRGNNERLVDYSDRIIAIEDGHWFRLFDYNFKQIAVRGKTQDYEGIIGVAGETVTIQEGHWIRTYDKKFKLINTRS